MTTFLLIIIYIAFISLGLPDALLGAAWPAMRPDFDIPVSFAGMLQVIIAGSTIVSSMNAGRVLHRFGTGKVTVFSVEMTAFGLLGFALFPSFWWFLIAAVPLGLGAGAVDAGLNAFVTAHYESRHMSWLHSFWGVGALSGPLVLAIMLRNNFFWRSAYLSIGIFQLVLVVLLVFSVPLWKKVASQSGVDAPKKSAKHPSLAQVIGIHGVPFALVAFLFYCGIEASMGLWGGTYLTAVKG
ncbi:MAG TPA: MFS transporter, partial [Chitinispirillaceae bacterium]|nr:MFS transporter [Chitinispirillaceae bacterium]